MLQYNAVKFIGSYKFGFTYINGKVKDKLVVKLDSSYHFTTSFRKQTEKFLKYTLLTF